MYTLTKQKLILGTNGLKCFTRKYSHIITAVTWKLLLSRGSYCCDVNVIPCTWKLLLLAAVVLFLLKCLIVAGSLLQNCCYRTVVPAIVVVLGKYIKWGLSSVVSKACTATSACCNGVQVPQGHHCCGNNYVFDPNTHFCCAGDPYPREEYGCCSGSPFRLDESICCGGQVVSNALGDSCCPPGDTTTGIPFFHDTHWCCGYEVRARNPNGQGPGIGNLGLGCETGQPEE